MQLFTKLDSALQVTADYPAALSLSSCHIRSQKIIFPKKGETFYFSLVAEQFFFILVLKMGRNNKKNLHVTILIHLVGFAKKELIGAF